MQVTPRAGMARSQVLERLEARTFFSAAPVLNSAAEVREFVGPRIVPIDAAVAPRMAELPALYDEFIKFKAAGGGNFHADNRLVRVVGDSVDIEVAGDDSAALVRTLKSAGISNMASAGYLTSGTFPIAALPQLATVPGLRLARASKVLFRTGVVTSQADAGVSAPSARSFYGSNSVTGAGVTVGVLSDSYNYLMGAATDISNNELKSPVSVWQDSSSTDEGRAMMQIIHDIAPNASLAFATANGGQPNFANNIRNLRNTYNAKVIVDDAFYPNEPMFQDGPIAQAVQDVTSLGVTYISAAGNEAGAGYESAFRAGTSYASGAFLSAPGAPAFLGGVAHDFDPGAGVANMQTITVPAFRRVDFSFQWDQPFFTVSGSPGCANDMDIYLLDASNKVVAASAGNNVGGDAVEVVGVQNNASTAQTLRLMLVRRSGASPGLMKYVAFGFDGGGASNFSNFATNSGTIYGHANVPEAAAVGADDSIFWSPMYIERYSSWGNTRVLFSTSGARLATARIVNKPDFTAPDDGNTSFFGQDENGTGYDGRSDADTFPNFAGTSAAAPVAAGVAALILQKVPGRTPAKVIGDLRLTATKFMSAAYDLVEGAGKINALSALQHAVNNP